MINKFFIASMFSLISISSFANSNWKVVGKTNEQIIGLDLNSISNVADFSYKNYKKVWVKNLIINDLTKDGMTIGDYTMILQWVSCGEKTIGYKSSTAYKKDGTVINNLSNSVSYVKMADVIPGTIGELVVDATCNSTE